MLASTESIPRGCDRIHVRVPVKIVVDREGARVCHPAATLDLSPFGSRVRCGAPLAQGDRVQLVFSGEPEQSHLSRVVWAALSSVDQSCEAGLQFLKPLHSYV